MKKIIFLSSLAIILLSPQNVQSKQSKELLKSAANSWDGSKIIFPQGEKEISAEKIILAANEELPFHCHPMPLFGYILSGELEIEKMNGEKKILKAGNVVVETVGIWHRGRNLSGTQNTEILAFNINQDDDLPLTILYSEENKDKCRE